uniref:Uncharacterized protein n=1 Tax=Macrostomum lignano TaxID=282301 RepID=A0A1I8JR27_9PLAT
MDEIITNRTLSFWKAISSQVSIVSNACALEFGAAATADSADFTSPTAADPTAAGSSTRRARVLTALERLVYFLTDDKLAANLELGNSNYRIVENRDDEAFDGAEEAGQFEHSAQPAASQVAKEVKSACHVLKSPSLLESQSERLAAYRRPFTERLQTLHVQLADLLSQLRHPARVNSALARLQLLRRLLPQLNSALQSAVMQPASSTAGTPAKRELLARALELVDDGIEAALMASSQAGTAAAASTAGSLAGGGIFVESGHFVLNVDELIFCLNEANRHFLRPSKQAGTFGEFFSAPSRDRSVRTCCLLMRPELLRLRPAEAARQVCHITIQHSAESAFVRNDGSFGWGWIRTRDHSASELHGWRRGGNRRASRRQMQADRHQAETEKFNECKPLHGAHSCIQTLLIASRR